MSKNQAGYTATEARLLGEAQTHADNTVIVFYGYSRRVRAKLGGAALAAARKLVEKGDFIAGEVSPAGCMERHPFVLSPAAKARLDAEDAKLAGL